MSGPKIERTLIVDPKAEAKDLGEKVLVCKQGSPVDILRFAVDQGARHIVPHSSTYEESEVLSSVAMLESPDLYFNFPLSVILKPHEINAATESGLQVFSLPFYRSAEKRAVIETLRGELKHLRQPQTLIDDILLAAEELFMNAIYNAPFVQTGKKVNRSEDVTLPMKPAGRILLGIHEKRLAIVCEDFYGTLNIQSNLKRVKSCYEEGVVKMMNFGEGGAGIGSYMVFNSCLSMFFGVRKNAKTIVSCVFPMNVGNRMRDGLLKSLHYIDC